MASDRNDIMEDEMPFKYTRLDAPVNAAAQAVCKLTREAPPSEVDPSKWRQLFAAQMGRTAHAQEAMKKLVGGGTDYDQLHKVRMLIFMLLDPPFVVFVLMIEDGRAYTHTLILSLKVPRTGLR